MLESSYFQPNHLEVYGLFLQMCKCVSLHWNIALRVFHQKPICNPLHVVITPSSYISQWRCPTLPEWRPLPLMTKETFEWNMMLGTVSFRVSSSHVLTTTCQDQSNLAQQVMDWWSFYRLGKVEANGSIMNNCTPIRGDFKALSDKQDPPGLGHFGSSEAALSIRKPSL